MPLIRLGVGCESQSKVLVSLFACKPPLLICRRSRVRAEKGESAEINMEKVPIQFSCLRIANDLPCFIKTLQAKGVVGEILVAADPIRRPAHRLSRRLRSLLILPLSGQHDTQLHVLS